MGAYFRWLCQNTKTRRGNTTYIIPLSQVFRSANPSAISIMVSEMNSVILPLVYGFALIVTIALSSQISEESPRINVARLFTADPFHPEYWQVRHCAPSQKGRRRPSQASTGFGQRKLGRCATINMNSRRALPASFRACHIAMQVRHCIHCCV